MLNFSLHAEPVSA